MLYNQIVNYTLKELEIRIMSQFNQKSIISGSFKSKQLFCLQDPTTWTQKLPSTAIMGLIVITLLLALLLTLNALRSQMYFYRNEDCTTKQNKEKKRKSRQRQMESKTIEYYNPLNITKKIIWDEQKAIPKDEKTAKSNEEFILLTTEEEKSPNHTKNQEPSRNNKDLQ